MSLTDFFSMGGYGAYVWSSYAITMVVLVINIIHPKIKEQKTLSNLQKQLYSEENK